MIITDLNNQTEMIIDVNNISIRRKLGGEQTLQFNALNTNINGPGYVLIQDDSTVEGNNERFIIKNIVESPYSKNVVAVNSFFENIDTYIEELMPSGLYTIQRALQVIFGATDWTYELRDSYPQQARIDDYGNENMIAALNKILNAFNSEYEIDSVNKRIIIMRRVGVDTDYQIRYKSNIQSINREIDSNDVKTQVQLFYNYDEFGNYNSSIIYRSPNFNKYPRAKIREPIYSDVITSESQAIATARLILKDTPDITISVDFLSLKQLGYNGDEIKLGNGVYLIDERMNIDSLARITEIEEFYKIERGQLVKDNSRPDIVTISNIRKNIINNIIEQQQQQASIERTAVKQRTLYNGCNISPEEGFTTTAMNGVKTYQNSTEGLRITVDDENQFFVDPINRQLTLDGRLRITSSDILVMETFKDEAGGLLNLYDKDGLLNIRMGSNVDDEFRTGGSLAIYSDGDRPQNLRMELEIYRDNDSGAMTFRTNEGLERIGIEAQNRSSNQPRINMSSIGEDSGTVIDPKRILLYSPTNRLTITDREITDGNVSVIRDINEILTQITNIYGELADQSQENLYFRDQIDRLDRRIDSVVNNG